MTAENGRRGQVDGNPAYLADEEISGPLLTIKGHNGIISSGSAKIW